MPPLKLVQVNIERSKHLERVIPFLEAEQPDVVCVQELMEKDVPLLARALNMRALFALMCFHPAENDTAGIMGVGIFSKLPITLHTKAYYHGTEEPVIVHTPGVPGTTACVFLSADIEKDGNTYRIGTTHFTWAAGGGTNDIQRSDLEALLPIIKSEGDIVFSGDFNAPRGTEIFTAIADEFTDNIPAEYTSSIDGSLHRSGPLPFMVDGIFSTPGYMVSNVEMKTGVSDHCAFVASITKK